MPSRSPARLWPDWIQRLVPGRAGGVLGLASTISVGDRDLIRVVQ